MGRGKVRIGANAGGSFPFAGQVRGKMSSGKRANADQKIVCCNESTTLIAHPSNFKYETFNKVMTDWSKKEFH